ncbi:uncharacterized protein F5891DRAFT_1013662 [Suillus fuscotomentosus]|uniref:Uncharacterized protein n=1 Tax=Suillus fuscotomentosus TaxID=1912939 RepID=A0AAD4HNI3_9AGAM|nr:uncharacterized protein F5891DRAFT_1013662 [Suillus fuscotomentosus]KAG1862859.1 hypothetical protein C8R48DRAFT_708650 [Suillus tomentosus]KAG1904260.1 hypothetical protein F5891DRAFT_1013662 [Suillus fuscotomentosus]
MQWEKHGFATKIQAARAENSSEAASLNGNKALTPIIAGSVCGGVLAIAWIVGLIWFLLKRRKSKNRNPPKETNEMEPYIIPPDPAILQGDKELNQHSVRISV